MYNSDPVVFYAVGAIALIAVVAWMYVILARLGALRRAVHAIADNTHALSEILDLLRSIDRNTSVLGGIRGVFGSRDRKKPR
jgi:hypothetical protein